MLENVSFLMFHDKGRTLAKILQLLNDIGHYNVHHALINCSEQGIPLDRGRKSKRNPRPNEYKTQAAAPAPDVLDASQEGPEVDEDIAPTDEELEEFPEDPGGDGGNPPV